MSEKKQTKQFGLWPSPISPERLSRGISFSDVGWDQDGSLVWRESRSGDGILVVQPPDENAFRDLNADYAARAGVGYGGGDFGVGHGHVCFVEAESKRLYRQPTASGVAAPLTPAFGAAASPVISPDGRFLLFVQTYEGDDALAVVDTAGEHWPQKLASGHDFVMQPCWHPGGEKIAWIAWDHPLMPWDGTLLKVGDVVYPASGLPVLENVNVVIGNSQTSIFQPEFSPDGRWLAYVSDRTGWWQLYLHDLESGEQRQLTKTAASEHGTPAWVQGMRTYGFSPDAERIYCLRNREGFISLWKIELHSGEEEMLPLPDEYSWLKQIAVHPSEDRLALIASGPRSPARVISFDRDAGVKIWRRSSAEDLLPETYAQPEAITWEGMDGGDVHGLFYPPHNPAYKGVGQPPLMVMIHGGPTSQRGADFYDKVQFFTSRGYAVLQVNYRGSTGYGRAYRDKLKGNWGIFDVEDAVSGARALAAQGRVDAGRMVIMGGSAGGFTVLKALEDYPGVFKAGVCSYGVANQFTLVADTHKFEQHYSDSLLGPLPEAAKIYHQRSPVFHADQIQDPVIVFQGEEDKVVPPSQSEAIVEALKRGGVPHEYHLYPGEGHGFRKPETIKKFYRTLERFLQTHVIYSV
jgi:dipeptidyl aminopeptidase/acylaminoacyl peptidase